MEAYVLAAERSSPGARIITALAVVLLLLGIIQHELRPVSIKYYGVVVLVLLVYGLRPLVRQLPARIIGLGVFLFVLSVLVVGGRFLLVPEARSTANFAHAALFATIPWVSFLLVFGRSRGESASADLRANLLVRWQPTLVISGAFVLLAIAHWWLRRDFALFFDEPTNLLQAQLMSEPGFARAIEPSLSRFFSLQYAANGGGRLYTQYPPGQPALLALFDVINLRWWTGVVTTTVSVAFTYLLGRDLVSRGFGLLAAAMLATNSLVLLYGPSYMSHGAGLALTTSAAWFTLRGTRSTGRARIMSLVAAGLLLGGLVAVRPLTGATMTVSIVLWQWLLDRQSWRDVARVLTCFAIGSVLPISALLFYNEATTGSPLTFGYTAIHGDLHDLGFGERGFVGPDETGNNTVRSSHFGPKEAVMQQVGTIPFVAEPLYPALLFIAPLALLLAYRRERVKWGIAAAFLIGPAVHVFYFYTHPRFFLELFPLLFVGIVVLVAKIRTRERAVATTVVAAILLGQVVFGVMDLRQRANSRSARYVPVVVALRSEQASKGRVLAFVKGERLLHFVSLLNGEEKFPGPIIVARDLGSHNSRLIERFPGYAVVHVDSVGTLTRP